MKYLLALLLVSCSANPPTSMTPPDMTMCDQEYANFELARKRLFDTTGLTACMETSPNIKIKSTDDFMCGGALVRRDENIPESFGVEYNLTAGKPFRVFGNNPAITPCIKEFKGLIFCPITFKNFYC